MNGAATYTSGPISPVLTSSLVLASNGLLSGGVNTIQTAGGPLTDFEITLASSPNLLEPWLSNGLPNLGAISLANSSGLLETGVGLNNQLGFFLTSLTATSSVPPGGTSIPKPPPTVPQPAALWLCISGLGTLGSYRRILARE